MLDDGILDRLDEAGIEPIGQRRGENEAARLHAHHLVNRQIRNPLVQVIYRFAEALRLTQ